MTREQKLEAALRDMVHAVCGPTGLHEAVKFDTGMSYPWPALDLAEDAAMLALTTPPDASWEDRTDEFTGAIDKAHPHHTKDFPTYTKALELVSNRHSKGALVGLVNYLLSQVPAPNPDTRVVSVDKLKLWSTVIEATESCLKTWNGTGSFMNVDGALSQIRAIIEGKDQ